MSEPPTEHFYMNHAGYKTQASQPITDAELEHWESAARRGIYPRGDFGLRLLIEVRRLREENAEYERDEITLIRSEKNWESEYAKLAARVRELEAALERFVAFGEYGGIDGRDCIRDTV